MAVTATQLRAALNSVGGLGGQKWSLDQLAREATEAMASSGVTTRQGAAAFVAQCMIESDYFRAASEYGGSRASYAPYYGRSFIQVTHAANYRAMGAWAKRKGLVSDANYFYNNPSKLAEDKWKWLGAVWFLSTHRHNLIKLGNEGKIDAVGKGVHCGDAYASWYPRQTNDNQGRIQRNRFNHNRKAYNALLNAGITAPGGSSSSGSHFWTPPSSVKMTVKQIQEAAGVTADGKYGSGTKAAVKKLQKKLGVTADGLFGPATESAYKKSQKSPASKPAASKPAAKPAASKPKDPNLTVDGKLGPATYKALQKVVGVTQDGKFGPATKRATQKWLKVSADGIFGKGSIRALQRKVGAEPVDGVWGSGTTKALQRWLNKNG